MEQAIEEAVRKAIHEHVTPHIEKHIGAHLAGLLEAGAFQLIPGDQRAAEYSEQKTSPPLKPEDIDVTIRETPEGVGVDPSNDPRVD